MTAIDIRNLATALIALVAAGACFAYAATNQRRRAKKPVYFVAGIGFVYWFFVYIVGVIDGSIYLIKSGWLGAIGYYLLAFAFLALLITDWRRTNDRN